MRSRLNTGIRAGKVFGSAPWRSRKTSVSPKVLPIVEVAGQYQRGFRRDVGGYVFENRHILFDAVAFQKVEVGAKADDGHFPAIG